MSLAMTDFTPTFDVSWDTVPDPPKPAPRTEDKKINLDLFQIDEAFAGYEPSFSTEVAPQPVIKPEPIEKITDISQTIAAKIFTEYCQTKFGFTPIYDQ